MTVLSMTDARQDLSRIANQVAFGGERICIEKNGKLALLNAQKSILEVLDITKLDSLFEVYKDVQTALESMES